MKNYTWFKTHEDKYTVIHLENGVETVIAVTDTAEKADFICKACNQFDLEKYEADNLIQP